MTTYHFEEPTAEALHREVWFITQKAVDAGLGYQVKTYKAEGGWRGAIVTVDAPPPPEPATLPTVIGDDVRPLHGDERE